MDDENYEFNISINSPMIHPLCGRYSNTSLLHFTNYTDSITSIVGTKSSKQTGKDNTHTCTSHYTETRCVNTSYCSSEGE